MLLEKSQELFFVINFTYSLSPHSFATFQILFIDEGGLAQILLNYIYFRQKYFKLQHVLVILHIENPFLNILIRQK